MSGARTENKGFDFMNELVKTIKEIHKEDICLFKIGTFYHCYNRDACILAYLFGYKLKITGENTRECGFPVNSLNKIRAKLEDKKINYAIIDKRSNYDEEEFCNFKNLNRYREIYEKSNIYITYKGRIENINDFLLEHINEKDFRKILGRIEDIIYDRG